MIRGLYTAASGMLLNDLQSDTIDQNLENINTPGYRQAGERITAFPEMLINRISTSHDPAQNLERVPIGTLGTGVYSDLTYYSEMPGLIRKTENMTDIALNSGGYFVVETLQGERYTRDGHFQIDQEGMLRTAGGNPVLGEKGAIGPLPNEFVIKEDGTVTDNESGKIIDRLRVVDIPAQDLRKEGLTNLFNTAALPVAVSGQDLKIEQGFVEESNVNLNEQMVKMLEVAKAYAANQKLIQTNDSLLQKAVNEIGKV